MERHLHELAHHDQPTSFLCNGCRRRGYGFRYRCNLCDFHLHPHCATCPRTVFFFMHQHPLQQLNLQIYQGWSFRCNVCNLPIHGSIIFGCTYCDFHAHPICTQIPQRVVGDFVHPFHELEYMQDNGRGICNGCSRICDGWRYRCVQAGCTGGFQFHRQCLRGPPPPPIQVGGNIVPRQRVRWIAALLSYIRHGFDIVNIIAAIFSFDLDFLYN